MTGTVVLITTDSPWCGTSQRGEVGVITEVHIYPPDISPALFDVRIPGRSPRPLRATELVAL